MKFTTSPIVTGPAPVAKTSWVTIIERNAILMISAARVTTDSTRPTTLVQAGRQMTSTKQPNNTT